MDRWIYLLRHGDSAEKKSGGRDKDRQLSGAGIDQINLIASFIIEKHIAIDQIVTSTAVRTEQTAELINQSLKLPKENISARDEIYEASMSDLVRVINQFDNNRTKVLLIGHNPGLSLLTGYLSGADPVSMSTAGLVAIRFSSIRWNEITEASGKIMFHTDPQKIKHAP